MNRWWLGVILLTLLPASAEAQEEEARHRFRLGEAHYESGHFVEAAREFEASYRLSGRPELLHNIYVAYRDASDLPRAADALRRYLAAIPDAGNANLLRQRLAAMERTIAEGGPAPPSPDDPDPAPPSSTEEGSLSPIGFIVGGAGAALMLAGAITGGVALAQSDELAARCPNMACPGGYDFEGAMATGSALALATDVLLPVGAAALVAGVVLILLLREESETLATSCDGSGCSASIRF